VSRRDLIHQPLWGTVPRLVADSKEGATARLFPPRFFLGPSGQETPQSSDFFSAGPGPLPGVAAQKNATRADLRELHLQGVTRPLPPLGVIMGQPSVILAHPRHRQFQPRQSPLLRCRSWRPGARGPGFHDLYQEKLRSRATRTRNSSGRAYLHPDLARHCPGDRPGPGYRYRSIPTWWASRRAILKGWVDRGAQAGGGYPGSGEGDGGERRPRWGLLQARPRMVFQHPPTPPGSGNWQSSGDPLETLWKKLHLWVVRGPGFFFSAQNFAMVVTSTPAQRQVWLEEVRGRCYASLPPA